MTFRLPRPVNLLINVNYEVVYIRSKQSLTSGVSVHALVYSDKATGISLMRDESRDE